MNKNWCFQSSAAGRVSSKKKGAAELKISLYIGIGGVDQSMQQLFALDECFITLLAMHAAIALMAFHVPTCLDQFNRAVSSFRKVRTIIQPFVLKKDPRFCQNKS